MMLMMMMTMRTMRMMRMMMLLLMMMMTMMMMMMVMMMMMMKDGYAHGMEHIGNFHVDHFEVSRSLEGSLATGYVVLFGRGFVLVVGILNL